ncbi:50S ribosomal protein L16 [Candidatus Pacearchaeota archaeon]|nr:50S ribosomal protein L16 [Candidatus Pacearchaeota archaeon]
MALRKALSYSKKYTRPYTRRSSVKSKSYIKTVPNQKIPKFKMGQAKEYDAGKLKFVLKVLSGGDILMRDNAIESARQYIHKELEENILGGQYYFAVMVYPHHILRENKMLTGAGADRMQTGMQLSFGATIGRAAIIKAGQPVFTLAFADEKSRRIATSIVQKIKSKLPGHIRFLMEQLK